MRILVYGCGAFGFALLKHLDTYNDNHQLFAYDVDTQLMQHLQKNRSRDGHIVSDDVQFFDQPQWDVDVIVLSVPSTAVRSALQSIKATDVPIINTAKALDPHSGCRFSQVCAEVAPSLTYVMLAGGTTADDLYEHHPLGVDIACTHEPTLQRIADLFRAPTLYVYQTTDVAAVECAAAFKNVLAIFAGIVKGAGYSYGSETHFITRGSAEIAAIMSRVGVDPSSLTMASQSWGNDLWMSCTGKTRNRAFGMKLGEGLLPADALSALNTSTVEGLRTLGVLIDRVDLKDFPIIAATYRIAVDGVDAKQELQSLMGRVF